MMNIRDTYPVFVIKQLTETKNYYVKWLQFEVIFESTWFLLLKANSENPYHIAFMHETHPTSPPSMPAIDAKSGVFLTLEVEDAKMEYEKFTKANLEIYYHLKAEAWGQKRFGLVDPNGMYVDIVEQIAPEEGYWDQYMPSSR